MRVIETEVPGLLIVEPRVHRDARGFFVETYHAPRYREHGIADEFVQDNHSRSTRGALRGLHGQHPRAQAKLVRAILGEIFDVAVDVRPGSPTFGKWFGATLSSGNHHQLWVPAGFIHGFCVLSETAEVEYKCTDFYDPGGELGVLWNDPAIGIEWPLSEPILSAKDAAAPLLAEVEEKLAGFR